MSLPVVIERFQEVFSIGRQLVGLVAQRLNEYDSLIQQW